MQLVLKKIKAKEQLIWELILALTFICLIVLRLGNLGYSEYLTDEVSVLEYLKDHKQFYSANELMSYRKGPVSFILAYIPYIFTQDPTLEYIFRLPFAFSNILALWFLYQFVKNISGNKFAAYLSMIIYGVNGFTVAFGRIVQYQSLNMLFSFMSLYYFSFLLHENKNYTRYIILGSLFFSLSLLSHWDAIFILPYIAYAFVVSKFPLREKAKYITISIVTAVILTGGFLAPYVRSYYLNSGNQEYFNNRIGSSFNIHNKITDYAFRTELYNPFYFLNISLVLLTISLLFIKHARVFVIWFLLELLVFLVYVRSPGTHIYNFLLPISIACGICLSVTVSLLHKWEKVSATITIFICLGFLYHQSYMLFVDVTNEYPWDIETIYKTNTKLYSQENLTNNIIGFPINRNWKEINDFVNKFNNSQTHPLPFITNENRSIAAFYMDAENTDTDPYYFAVGIKNPFSFARDYKFPQIKNKRTVKLIEKKDETVARIYVVTNENY